MGVVYVKTDSVVRWSQGQSPLSKGDVWDDQAALVLERPDLFDQAPTRVRGVKAKPPANDEKPVDDEKPVERATARPGDKRQTPARRKSE